MQGAGWRSAGPVPPSAGYRLFPLPSFPAFCLCFLDVASPKTGAVEGSRLQTSISPADLHGMWYPTVRRTLVCLSKLYRCIDVSSCPSTTGGSVWGKVSVWGD